MDLCRIYADFCIYAVAFLLSFLIFVCELNFAEYMRRPIINEKLPISESNPIKARHYDYDRFTYPWHFHSQYEIIYVKESHGLCFVGDCIEKFSAGDVILFGTNLPHYMRSNDIYGSENATSRVQGTIIQFEQNFMQYSFDYYPQFLQIKMLLEESKRGIIFPKQDATRVGELLSGNFIQFEVTGVVIVYKGNDFINPLVPQRRKLFVIMQTCQRLSLRTDRQLLQQIQQPAYLVKTT